MHKLCYNFYIVFIFGDIAQKQGAIFVQFSVYAGIDYELNPAYNVSH